MTTGLSLPLCLFAAHSLTDMTLPCHLEVPSSVREVNTEGITNIYKLKLCCL